jgi:hypothetical protein
VLGASPRKPAIELASPVPAAVPIAPEEAIAAAAAEHPRDAVAGQKRCKLVHHGIRTERRLALAQRIDHHHVAILGDAPLRPRAVRAVSLSWGLGKAVPSSAKLMTHRLAPRTS